MNKALSFVRLDYFTVKPYMTLKNLAIFLFVACFMAATSKSTYASIGMFMVFASMYATTPFSLGEKNNIDALYTTLSIKRSAVVFGRYLFALVVDLCAGLCAFVISLTVLQIIGATYDNDIREALTVSVIMFVIISVIQTVQLPLFFKLGYSKAKFFSYLPFLGMFALSGILITFFNNDTYNLSGVMAWFESNLMLAAAISATLWVAIMFVSYKVSLSYYNKRDF